MTVRFVDPEIPLKFAEIMAEPGVAAVANPFEPGRLLTEATLGAEELQVTEPVRSCVE